MNKRATGKAAGAGPAALALGCALMFSAPGTPALAQGHISIEEKIRYEEALALKVQEVLANMLGPNQARVAVDAKVEKPKEEAKQEPPFKWAGIAQDPSKSAQQLLPGYYSMIQDNQPRTSVTTTFLPFLIKSVTVNIVLDTRVSTADAARAGEVVKGLLNLDEKRGDAVNIVRASFLPVWKSMLSNPESANMLARYGLISVIVVISMIILAASVIKLAGAMSNMAQVQQAHQIEMSFSGGKGGAAAAAEAAPGGAAALPGAARAGGDRGAAAAEEGGEEEIVFNVKMKHVPLLKFMLEREEPANIALIVSHLPPEPRRALMGSFDRQLSSKIMMNMATVRFVETDIVEEIKEELERKLASAMGGVPKVIEFMDELGFAAKKDLLRLLEAQEPALAAEIRARTLLDDDLARLAEKDLSTLISAFTLAEWGDAMPALSAELKNRLKAQLPERSWQIIEQNMKFAAQSPEKRDAALEKLLAGAEKLIREGKIARPPLPNRMIGK